VSVGACLVCGGGAQKRPRILRTSTGVQPCCATRKRCVCVRVWVCECRCVQGVGGGVQLGVRKRGQGYRGRQLMFSPAALAGRGVYV